MSTDLSMSDEHLVGETSAARQWETDIEHIFKQHLTTLHIQKWKIVEQINEWSATLMHQIQEHVTAQRNLLDQVCEKKASDINTLRDRVLKKAVIHDQKNETKKLKHLLSRCTNLKYELATLAYIERPIGSIQLVTEEQLMQKNQNESNENKTENELIKNHDSDVVNITETDESPSSLYTEPRNIPSSMMKPTNDEDQSINSSYKLEKTVSKRGDMAEKCPICFMIFPQSMSAHNRNIHVNEHYYND